MQKQKTWRRLLLLGCLVGQLTACVPKVAPIAVVHGGGSTPAPAELTPIAPQADSQQQEKRVVSLYYRMQGEDLLARETRTIWLPKDRQLERVLIESLIEGPSAKRLELSGVFVPGTQLRSLYWQGEVLYVTLSETFLEKPPDVPEQWEADPIWRTEVLMRRKLALDMIVNTIVDATHCTAVQLLIQKDGSDQQGRRMMRMELFASETDPTQLLGLAQRSETMILTHYHTASIILRSWQHKEWQRLYRFVAQQSGRPTANAFAQMVAEDSASLLSFSITPGQVSADGQQAVLNVQLELSNEDGTSTLSNSIPMHIALENGIWKISYAMLSQLMQTR